MSGCRVVPRVDGESGGALPRPAGYIVRTAIVVPSDRSLPEGARSAHAAMIEDIRDFFADEMERHGYGRVTFRHEAESDSGRPMLHVVRSSRTSVELASGSTLEHHNRLVADAIAAGCSIDRPGEVWLLLSESWWQRPDGSLDGMVALGIRGRRNGNDDNGVGVRSGPVLQVVRVGAMGDDTPVTGSWWQVLGSEPLTVDSFPFYDHATRSGIASSIIGAVAHELGHCFGLLHAYDNDGLWCGDRQHDRACVHYGVLMGNGFRAWRSRERPSRFSTRETPEFIGLAAASADLLSLSPFFGGSDPRHDPSPPDMDEPLAVDFDAEHRRLRLRGRARDKESGIALVQLYNGHEIVWSERYSQPPAEVLLDVETDRMPPRGSGRWRLRVFNNAFREREVWLAGIPDAAVGQGVRAHVIPLQHRVVEGEAAEFRVRVLRVPDGEAVASREWHLAGEIVGEGEEFQHAFDLPGVHELRAVVRTTGGLATESMLRVWVEPSARASGPG